MLFKKIYRHATVVIGALIVPLKFRRQLINVAKKKRRSVFQEVCSRGR